MPFKDPEKRRAKNREYNRKHYAANKEKILARSKIYKGVTRQRWIDFKSSLSCAHCGFSHPAALDFHHHTPDPMNIKINRLVSLGAYALAMREIEEKCIVLCSNCHRVHHFDEREEKKRKSALKGKDADPAWH